MSEPIPDPRLASTPELAEDPWRVAFVELKARDEKMVKEYQEEIDTLLVFAGLFSAVLTAFVVESYQSLQEDPSQTSADLLRQISRQLADPSLSAAADSSQFQAQPSDIRVNVCWFVSLLLSLFVALFGIFLKQWMRSYMKWTDVTPDQEAVAVRQFRYRSLETWRLGAILTLLPTLLQLSVIVFLSGLLVFLSNLDRTVAIVMIVLTSIAFSLVATVTVLPALLRSCPYRSPLSEILMLPLWSVACYVKLSSSSVRAFIQSGWKYDPKSWFWIEHADQWRHWSKDALPKSWLQADKNAINSDKDHFDPYVDTMIHLCCTTQSQPLWSAAVTVIVAEPEQEPIIGQTYCNEVWGPMLGHIMSLHEQELGSQSNDLLELFWRVVFKFRRFSSSMKNCWLDFLLHSRSHVCRTHSGLVVESYLLCCIASMEPTTAGPCMLAFMEVLKDQCQKLETRQLERIRFWLLVCASTALDSDALFQGDLASATQFIQHVKEFCDKLNTDTSIQTHTSKFRSLLAILTQLACQAAMANERQPWANVPDDLTGLLRALERVYEGCSTELDTSFGIVHGCETTLIFVARNEPDFFPKPLARAMVRRMDSGCFDLDAARHVEGLDLRDADMANWMTIRTSLDAYSCAVIERLIEPGPFSRILDVFPDANDDTEVTYWRQCGLNRV